MNISDFYRDLINNTNNIFCDMIEHDGLAKLTISHNYLLDYDKLKLMIGNRPEVAVLDAAVKEYQFALFALVSGQYRHAFVGLRLFFELMLSLVQFSAHEIDFRMWIKDEKDINWNSLRSTETGIFSKNFVKAFNPCFADIAKQYGALAETVYRECSEFVHGNANTHSKLSIEMNFQKEIFNEWHVKATTMRLVIVFAFTARYLNHVDRNSISNVESVILDVLGHLQPVQELFSQPNNGN